MASRLGLQIKTADAVFDVTDSIYIYVAVIIDSKRIRLKSFQLISPLFCRYTLHVKIDVVLHSPISEYSNLISGYIVNGPSLSFFECIWTK